MSKRRGTSVQFLRLCCCSIVFQHVFAARPEDAVFTPGTLPLDDQGKEV